MERKRYKTPELQCLGTVQKLTQQGGEPNSDVPRGPANSAYKAGLS